MRFLITGVAGHLGSRLAQFIIDQGAEHEIIGVMFCFLIDDVDRKSTEIGKEN